MSFRITIARILYDHRTQNLRQFGSQRSLWTHNWSGVSRKGLLRNFNYMKIFKETHALECMRFGARGCMSTVFKCIEGLQLLNGASVPLYKLIAAP